MAMKGYSTFPKAQLLTIRLFSVIYQDIRWRRVLRWSLNNFPDFFRMALLLIGHTWNSCSLQVISSGCNALVVPFQQLLQSPMEALLCERVNDLRHSPFHLLNCLITTASETRKKSKSHWEQGLDYREAEKLSLCPSWSNSLWQGWSCGLVLCPSGNTTDPIWIVLTSSQGNFFLDSLKTST